MAIARVQATGTTSNVVAYGSDNTAGNLLVMCTTTSDDVTGVTDTAGNTWVKAVDLFDSGGPLAVDIWYVENCKAGANTVTAANSFGSSFCAIWVAEYSGIATSTSLDKTASALDPTNNPNFDSGATSTTSQADELLVGAAGNLAGLTSTWTSPDTEQFDSTAGANRHLSVADQIVSATGTYSASGTWSSSTSNDPVLIATFKAAAGGTKPLFRPQS